MRFSQCRVLVTLLVASPAFADAQTDSVLERIRAEGMTRSRIESLGFALIDSIGPRLTGSPEAASARTWLIDRYREWNIPAEEARYGTWPGWRRGSTHVDLITPRARTLDAHLASYSGSLRATAQAVIPPMEIDSASVTRWAGAVRGKIVLISPAIPSCRSETGRAELSATEVERLKDAEHSANSEWVAQIRALTLKQPDSIYAVLARAGAVGLVRAAWSGGWGATRAVGTPTDKLPVIGMSCEDYGLVYRLARRGTAPMLRVEALGDRLGSANASNVIATLRGTDRADEYVMLSAHLDSWDGASGATDNGSGTLIMLEAMRILRTVYPHPRRSIIAGHWDGEEQGLNGSQAFAEDHPEIVRNLHVLLNQDNGTGRITGASLQGFTSIGSAVRRWLAVIPGNVIPAIAIDDPGSPGGGTDYASFTCRGVPAIALESTNADYNPYTWHSSIDTYDKLSIDDLRRNATVVAMLAYLASEEPTLLSRDRLRDGPDTGRIRMRAAECGLADRTGERRIR